MEQIYHLLKIRLGFIFSGSLLLILYYVRNPPMTIQTRDKESNEKPFENIPRCGCVQINLNLNKNEGIAI